MLVQMSRRRGALRADARDEGAAVLEYVGMIIALAFLVVSLTLLFTPMGKDLSQKLCEAVTSVTGGSCSSSSADVPGDRRPTKPCVTNTSEFAAKAGVSIAFVDLGSGMKMVTERLSDGTYRVTLVDTAKLGASLSAGEAVAKLRIGGYGGEAGLSASVSGALEGAYGREYTFGSAQDVADFQEWAAREYSKNVAKGVAGPPGGLGIEVGTWLWNKITGYDYRPPEPSATYGEANVVVSGQAMAEVVTAGARGDLSFGSGAGVRRDSAGNITVYTKVTLDANAAADLGLQTVARGSAGVETVVSVVVDPKGNVTEVGFTGAASAEGAYDLTRLAGTPMADTGGRGVGLNATFPVTDANRAGTIEALRGLGVVNVNGGVPMGQAAAVPWILSQARDKGDITVQTYDVAKNELLAASLGLKVPGIGGLGLSADATTSEKSSTGAWYLGRDGWQKWEECS